MCIIDRDQSLLGEAQEYDNLIVLKTCSKAFGMAGIRLGFAVANPTATRAIQAVKSPYNVNSITQEVGTAVLREQELLRARTAEIIANTKELYRMKMCIRDRIIEGIRRKPINRKYESIINLAGLALLMGLMLFVTFNDVFRLFQG